MARVRYVGTGEAFDDRFGNTSLLYEGRATLLLDCGYAVPHAFWRIPLGPDELDGVYLTHFHADHCFGLPALLCRLGEDGRRRPLQLLGGPGAEAQIRAVLELGYPGMLGKAPFQVMFREIEPERGIDVGPVRLDVAASGHSLPNFAVRITEGGRTLCYSGDGAPTDATRALYRGASLLVHEAYYAEPTEKRSHASAPEVIAMARDAGAQMLHLVHLSRHAAPPSGVHCPRPGDVAAV